MSEFYGEQSPNSDWGAGYDAGFGMAQKAIATAELLERQRIIKLISNWDFPVRQGTYTVDDSVKSLIALIKGEEVMSFEPTHEDIIRQSAFLDGEAYAEARIIKLLEAEYERGGYEMGIVPYFIALIKGEK